MRVTEICGSQYRTCGLLSCDTAGRAIFTNFSKEHSASVFILKTKAACSGISSVITYQITLCSKMKIEFIVNKINRRSYILLLVANGHQNCIKCNNADVRLRTPDDGRTGCPKHVES